MDAEIIPGMQRLLTAFRAAQLPVIHVTTAYEITDRNAPFTDMGMWHNKIPLDAVNLKDTHLWAIDSRIAPVEGEHTLLKKRASAFHGTPLAGMLRTAGVDTILVTGVTACACVRTTLCDGLGEGSAPLPCGNASVTACRASSTTTCSTSTRNSPTSKAWTPACRISRVLALRRSPPNDILPARFPPRGHFH